MRGVLATALTVAALALTGCGDDVEPSGTSSPTDTATVAEPEPIVIKTQVDLPEVDILDGSTVGTSPFCADGTAEDQHGTESIGFVDRTITCSDGTLRIGFDPGPPAADGSQGGPWRIVSGTGAYEGWTGDGDMTIAYDPTDKRKHPLRGMESFTGTVVSTR
ncbi:MAG TPA: hypothetical protein VLI04_02660 [Nocardioidaceae bacterium]|nr:hypothetical protein [Nocardioidaceae bacterium]